MDTPLLDKRHLKNIKVLTNREELILKMPKKGVVAELGVDKGDFSKKILLYNEPEKLILIDSWNTNRYNDSKYSYVKNRFKNYSQVIIDRGFSENRLKKYDDNYFDWLYIDTTHSYQQTKKELELAKDKVKIDGYITGHDYCTGNVNTGYKYGVITAVHEFCIKYNYEICYLTLDRPPSFALKKIESSNMKLLINKKEIDIEKDKFKGLDSKKLFNKIKDDLDDEIIDEIFINDVEVNLEFILENNFAIDDAQKIEITTKKNDLLIKETLREADEYLPNLKNAINDISELFRTEEYNKANELFNQAVDGLEWYLNILNSIIDLKEENQTVEEVEKLLKKFNMALNRAMISLNKEEYNDFADLLEVEIIEYLDRLKSYHQKLLDLK